MLKICQLCGKRKEVGHNVSYSKRRTRRVFLPNLHFATLNLEGQTGRMLLCMKCLKKAKREGQVITKVSREDKVANLASQDQVLQKKTKVVKEKPAKIKATSKKTSSVAKAMEDKEKTAQKEE